MSVVAESMEILANGDLKCGRDSLRVVELMQSLDGQLESIAKMQRKFRHRLALWRTCALYGIDFKEHKRFKLVRKHSVRPDTVTGFEFEYGIPFRKWMTVNYIGADSYLMTDRRVTGVLDEDFPNWLRAKGLTDEQIFYRNQSRDLESGQPRITSVILQERDRPKRELTLAEPVYIPRSDD